MPLIPLRPLMEATIKYGFGQGAFNVNAVAQAKAAIEVHEMFRSPAILQGADLANGFMGGRTDFMNATLEDKKIGAVDFLVQGTIYPDVVESGLGGESAVIKSHHNVGGLPDCVDFKEIIQPLRDLFKAEVWKAELELGIP